MLEQNKMYSFKNIQLSFVQMLTFFIIVVSGAQNEEEYVLTSRTIYFNANESVQFDLRTESYPVTIYMDETSTLTFNYTLFNGNNTSESLFASRSSTFTRSNRKIFVQVNKENLVELLNTSIRSRPVSLGTQESSFVLQLKGKLPGRAKLLFKLSDEDKIDDTEEIRFKIYIELKEKTIDRLFTGTIVTMIVLANIGMGAKVDLEVVKTEMKRPIAVLIGMCSQFIIMPLIAFTLAYNLPLDPGVALGFFALGCSPGGSASNAYTYLLKGNISLSITMTLISSLAALGFLPLWLFTLGKLIYSKGNISIPYANIFFSLIGIIAPVGIGLLLQWKLPKVANFFIKSVKYIIIVFFIFVLSVGIYINQFIFHLISWDIIIASACLPYLGLIFGAIFAFMTRQSKANIIAIAVETGIQNTGIPIILLRLSLSGPDKDTGIVTPVVSALFTPIPIMCGIAYVQTKSWLEKRHKSKKGAEIDKLCEEQRICTSESSI